MSDETSESSSNFSNFSMNTTTGATPEPILSLVSSLLNSQTPTTNNFIINTPDLIAYESNRLQSSETPPNSTPDESTHPESEANSPPPNTTTSLQINGRRYVVPGMSIPTSPIPRRIIRDPTNTFIDFLNFVENDILSPPPPPPPQNTQTSEEAATGNLEPSEESEDESNEEPPLLQMRRNRNSIVRAINRTRNRRRGMFFQQFMNHLMDNADEQILQQVMHESFVEDQEKRLIDQARELDIQKVKYDPSNKELDKCTSCRICFSEYEKDEEIGILPCKHFFHHSCIQEWGKRRPVCPFCDIDIPTVNEQASKKQKTS